MTIQTNTPLPNHTVAYVGKPIPHSGCGATNYKPRHELTGGNGKQIGTCFISSSWRVRSYIGSHMCQIYAIINSVHYTGRGFGEGMSVRLRPCAKQ
jgi:hypothetical protein